MVWLESNLQLRVSKISSTNILAIVNPLNYKIKFGCDANVICLGHASQLFFRELVNSENEDVPTLIDKVKLFISNKKYSENNNVLPKGIDQSINDDKYLVPIINNFDNYYIRCYMYYIIIYH